MNSYTNRIVSQRFLSERPEHGSFSIDIDFQNRDIEIRYYRNCPTHTYLNDEFVAAVV